MILMHASHVFELRHKTKFEVCDPGSFYATYVVSFYSTYVVTRKA